MGELKSLREQQESWVARAKEFNQQLLLAGIGGYSRAETEATKLADQYAEAGREVLGESAADTGRALLVARGLAASATKLNPKSVATQARAFWESLPEKRKAAYEQWVEAGREEQKEAAERNELVLAGVGVVSLVRNKSQALFNELVSAGNERKH